jgi:hypothetical protein
MCAVPDSTNIAAVGYDVDRELMRVRFRDGSEYDYSSVSSGVYAELIGAPSIGVHFAANIRGKFESVRRRRPRTRAHAS